MIKAFHFWIAPQSVANWLQAYADELPEQLPQPVEKVEVAEQDELFTFIGQKNVAYIMTIVNRQTRCFMAIRLVRCLDWVWRHPKAFTVLGI